MAWTTPVQRNTGDLITSSIWNTDIKDNLRYLKGKDGQVTIEDDIIPNSSSLTLGESANPWGEGDFYQLYAGPRYAVHRAVREIVVTWESDSDSTYQITGSDSGAGAAWQMGGFGQAVLKVDDNQAGAYWLYGQTEQNNALDTAFNASRSPYLRQEFAVNQSASNAGMFIGFRQTPGGALPVGASEHFAGLVWTGAIWQCQTGNASSPDGGGSETVASDQRHVIEILIISGTSVEFWLDGTLVETLTGAVPTGDLEWSVLIESDGGGGATDSLLTLGMLQLQEALS